MDLSITANLLNAIAVTIGVAFAAAQIRDYRRQRRRDAMVELVAGRPHARARAHLAADAGARGPSQLARLTRRRVTARTLRSATVAAR